MKLRRWIPVLALTISFAAAAPVPRHMRTSNGALTESSPRAPRLIGDDFTAARLREAGLPDGPAAGLYLESSYRTAHNGVTHLVYRQRFHGLDVHGGEWRVNIDRDGRVINAGGQLFAPPTDRPADGARLANLARIAVSAVNPILAREANVRRAGMTTRGDARFLADGMGETTASPVWYPVRGALRSAWHFLVTDGDGVSAYDTIVDANAETVLAKEPLTFFQSAPRGAVFTGISPQPPVQMGVQSADEPPLVERVNVPLTGSSTASPSGWISATETSGNNTVTGLNVTGTRFLTTPLTASSPGLDFQFPLQIGPNPSNFGNAATVNLFYWVNRAHDLFYDIGFDEAAGNFQLNNFSGSGLGGDPLYAYSHFGSQDLTGFGLLNNAFFTARNLRDGSQSMIAMYLTSNGGVWADGSFANDVIIHEYAHGVTGRLIPTMNAGFQGGAMNEGLSDFWSLEFLVPDGAPVDGVYPVAEYWSRAFGVGLRHRPYTTNMEVNPVTYADLGRIFNVPEIHDDGVLWAQALWEVRANLIRQFGEAEGRRRLRRIVIDGMKMSPPAPSMVDLRDAILIAERVDFNGASQSQLWEAFAKRGLGALAYSPYSESIQVTPSFDRPSATGQIGLQTETPIVGESLRVTVSDVNNTANVVNIDVTSSTGDLETFQLQRDGLAFSGFIPTTATGPAVKNSGSVSLMRGDYLTVYYNDASAEGGGSRLIEKTVQPMPNYGAALSAAVPFTFPNETATGLRLSPGTTYLRATLPFEFPFYDKKYREIRVYPEGYVQFGPALPPYCIDEGGFANITGISPMGMWMRTNGAAQPNENVYVSRGPNTYTIRWAGETIPLISSPPNTPVPEPVNFALTLHENGEIRFHYGAGNQNLINSTPFTGCIATTPWSGISRGIGNAAYMHPLGYERVSFKDAPTLIFLPPFGNASTPRARVESPAPGAKIAGALTVRGVAYDDDTLLSTVGVLIDGVFFGNATTGIARPDACTAEPVRGCPNVGFQRVIDWKGAGLKPGIHSLQVRVANAKGGYADYPENPLTIELEETGATQPVVVIEDLKSGDKLEDFQFIEGYAYSRTSRITAVDLLIDGVAYERTSYGIARRDICTGDVAASPNCPGIGWFSLVDSLLPDFGIPNGEHKIQVRVTEEGGRITFHPQEPIVVTVDNPANAAPKGVVTSPRNLEKLSGIVTVSGHAWDPDGRVFRVLLLVDGLQRATLRYGLPSAEACASLSNVPACPNIGFEGTLDTRNLTNGLHSLAVYIQDIDGRSVIIPAITSVGMNVVVENP